MDNYFGIRFGLYIVLFVVLGATILNLDNLHAMMGPMLLFLLPISLDYYTHDPKEEKNIKRRHKGLWIPFLVSCVLIGLIVTGLLQSVNINNFLVKLFIALPFTYFVLISGKDWTVYSSMDEKVHRDLIKEINRSQEFEPPKKRVKTYKGLETGKEY